MKRVLHLVRTDEPPPAVVADRDWVVYVLRMELAGRGDRVGEAGTIDHDQLVALVVAADRVITW